MKTEDDIKKEEQILNDKEFKKVASETTTKVLADSRNMKDYKTNALFENLFASVFHSMPMEHLENYRALMNKIIKERKETTRIINSKKIKAGTLDSIKGNKK